MNTFVRGLGSSIGKKILMGLTGLGMTLFAISHLIGNLLLLNPNPDLYNGYSHMLVNLGLPLYVAELGLVTIFLVHVVTAINITIGNRRAKPMGYKISAYAGAPSRKSSSSRTMIYTGALLFIFIVTHVKTFKYGPHYTTMIQGEEVRDLYRLVVETFQNPLYVIWYVTCTFLLGFHLRHGFWSAFQSLGANHPDFNRPIHYAGILVASILAFGFMGIPIYLYFKAYGA
jgi:succinate dehydrogenase / fumarate reductase cytochrome b subunit